MDGVWLFKGTHNSPNPFFIDHIAFFVIDQASQVMAKASTIHDFIMLLLIVLTSQMVLAQGRHFIEFEKKENLLLTQETVQTEHHFERFAYIAKKPSQVKIRGSNGHLIEQSRDVKLPPASVKFTSGGGHLNKLQHPVPDNTEATKVEHLASEDDVGHPESYRHRFQELTKTDSDNKDNGPRASTHSPGTGHPKSDNGFQEPTTTDSVNDNGRRPPPRASTQPGHSPGDGN